MVMFLYSLIRVFQINLDNFLMIIEILLDFQGRYSDKVIDYKKIQ